MPSWLSKIIIASICAVLVFGLIEGGSWLALHPLPDGTLMPLAMVAGLGALVYGTRKGR